MKDRGRWIIGALCVLYVAVRVWRLTDSCLWFDEIFGVHAAEHTWSGMFWFVAQDLIHPPLFYALFKLWIGVGGESLLWLRLFSVLFSILALFPFLHLCRELKLPTGATTVALMLFAVNGSLIKYAQEVRMYSLMLFLSLLSTWLFARFFYRGKNIWVLTLVNILLVHSHYFGWLIVLSEVLAIAILQRIKIRQVLVMAGISAVSFLPWLLAEWRTARAGADVSQNIGWIKPPGGRSLFELLTDLVEPFYFQVSSVETASVLWISIPALLTAGSAMSVWFANWKTTQNKERVWLLGLLVIIPVFAAFMLSWVSPYSVWGVRHLTIVFAPASILFAIFLWDAEPSVLKWASLAAVSVLILSAGVRYAAVQPKEQVWCAWEKLAAEIPSGKPQTIYAFEDLSAYHLWFATRKRGDVRIVKVEGTPGMIEDKAYFLPRGFDEVAKTEYTAIADDEFLVAFRDRKYDPRHPPVYFFQELGYEVFEPKTAEAGTMKAFLVRAKRRG